MAVPPALAKSILQRQGQSMDVLNIMTPLQRHLRQLRLAQRGGRRALSIHLAQLLRLVCRADKATACHEARETRAVAAAILAGAVKLLHPFMPYLTEELNQKIFGSSDLMIAAAWPEPVVQANGDAVEDLRFVIRLISDIDICGRK